MSIRMFKYLSPISFYAAGWISFHHQGFWVWLPMIYAWILIPLLELMIKPSNRNLDAAETEMAKKSRVYDYLLYLVVPLQFGALYVFLHSLSDTGLSFWDITGRTLSMGLFCGTFGINVAHELGHRNKRYEQLMAKALLATSLYMHFFIEHNKGHHKNVSTPEDPSSAHYNEPVYTFWFRTIFYSYLSAWKIAADDAVKKGYKVVSIHNEMLQAQLLQILLITAVFVIFGTMATVCFLAAAGTGILLLETVNYIEHYGLSRKKMPNGQYERAMPWHSWNSEHPLGRIMLFELSRHSDHHYLASKKYQTLHHHANAPQLPTGYPGSMLLALLPPVWFKVMNGRIERMEALNVKR